MAKIGILGGTFNPIHNGHLLLAEWAKEIANLDEIWIMPSGVSYLKRDQFILSGDDRMELILRAIEDNPDFKCIDVELKRTGDTYTFETLQELNRCYPENDFYFIVGADCLYSIENWYKPEIIFSNCILLAATRDGADIRDMELKKKELQERFNANIIMEQFLEVPISSTLIRNRIKENKSIRYLMPEKEFLYIREKGFFK